MRLNPGLVLTSALVAVRARPDVARQSLAHLAAVVEVFEQEDVRLAELLEVAHVLRLGLLTKNYFEVHDAASLRFFHLQGPHAARVRIHGRMLRALLSATVAVTLTHLQLERLADEIE